MTTPVPVFALGRDSAKRRLLEHYFTHPGAKHYLRELAALLKADPANLSRALSAFEAEGLFRSETRGNQKHFSLNRSYSLYELLRALLSKMAPGELPSEEGAARSAYVIAGPNGAGKTTFAKTFLPEYLGCETFINADLIASGLAPLAPDRALLRAGKLLLEEIRRTARKRIDFGFETALSGRSHVNLFRELRAWGYALHLFFLWIPNVEISLKRIRERVRQGGHRIPEAVVRRRFHRGLENLFRLYQPLAQSWTLFDNSGPQPKLVAYEEAGRRVIADQMQYSRILKLAGVK